MEKQEIELSPELFSAYIIYQIEINGIRGLEFSIYRYDILSLVRLSASIGFFNQLSNITACYSASLVMLLIPFLYCSI